MAANLATLLSRVGEFAHRFRAFLIRAGLVWLICFVVFSALPLDLRLYRDWSAASWFGDSISQHLLRAAESLLLPAGETILVISPFDPFTALMEIGAALALIVVLLYVTGVVMHYAWSAMYSHETYWASRLLVLIPVLFLGGIGVGVYLLRWLYLWTFQLAPATGAAPTVSLVGFISSTVVFLLLVGLGFEIPPLCAALAAAGLLTTRTMRAHWRGAAMGCVVLAFLISPGVGGGLIEFPLAAMFGALYAGSYGLVRHEERRRAVADGHWAVEGRPSD